MGADFSRVRLNPLLDYAGVELAQGRVLLDADMNELTGIIDRRLRALSSDVLGRARVSSTTPDAFKISVAGGTLQIGKGRLYVDGLLAENHGARSADPAKRVFDDLLAESEFADAIGYTAQPYLSDPPALPAADRHLIYLDVWDREVTHLEQPDLIESAVGVDATSRVQTVWQVRALAEDAGAAATCATPDADVPGWSALIAPSTGVLTTGTFEVAAEENPCELPPTGGYRGLENQLYRVELAAVLVDMGRVLVLNGARASVWSAAEGTPPARGSVLGNDLTGRGSEPTVDISADGECLFNDNRVETVLSTRPPTVRLATTIAIVHANRVRSGESGTKQAAVLGNITSGVIIGWTPPGPSSGQPTATWDHLNVRA